MHRIYTLLKSDVGPGLLLICTGLLAMIISNSPLEHYYFAIINTKAPINVHFIINEFLMAIFFLDVGLEIKHQIISSKINSVRQLALPIISACGGVIIPAAIFVMINYRDLIALNGWAIPTATDTAFALGVLMILGKRVPTEIRVLLLAIAIIDDLIAISIIAIFYSDNISLIFLGLSAICAIWLWILNRREERHITHYIIIGGILWFCILKSGLHATLTGVIVALAIPMVVRQHIHQDLFYWVSYFILPLFAFANAGVSLKEISWDKIFDPISIGIVFGLLFGKQLGIYFFARLGEKLKILSKPNNITWEQFYGMAILCGIGFTMSIFIGNLAYDKVDSDYLIYSKIGILLGSIIAGLIGYFFLRIVTNKHKD